MVQFHNNHESHYYLDDDFGFILFDTNGITVLQYGSVVVVVGGGGGVVDGSKWNMSKKEDKKEYKQSYIRVCMYVLVPYHYIRSVLHGTVPERFDVKTKSIS